MPLVTTRYGFILHFLRAPLIACRETRTLTAPSVSTAASSLKCAGYKVVLFVPPNFFSRALLETFESLAGNFTLGCEWIDKQVKDELKMEGDVVDRTSCNLFNHTRELLDEILGICLPGCVITIQAQATQTGMRMDHLIQIVCTTENHAAQRWHGTTLVVVEEKRPGLVQFGDWEKCGKECVKRAADKRQMHPGARRPPNDLELGYFIPQDATFENVHVKAQMPQVIKYCEAKECKRLLLTSYKDSIAFRWQQVAHEDRVNIVNIHRVDRESVREALFQLALEALQEITPFNIAYNQLQPNYVNN